MKTLLHVYDEPGRVEAVAVRIINTNGSAVRAVVGSAVASRYNGGRNWQVRTSGGLGCVTLYKRGARWAAAIAAEKAALEEQ
jgi:hypothetical protein